MNFLIYGNFCDSFLENIIQWLLLQINILLQKSGIIKHVAISVNNESTNNSSSKKYSIRFSFLLDLLVAAYKNTWDRISQENNSAGNDLFVVHFDQNFGCNFWMNR